jgi:hypothetical protein
MKTRIPFALLTAVTLFAASCGLSEKEKTAFLQAKKAKNDSLHIAEIQALQEEESYRATLRDSLTAYTNLLTRQQNALAKLRLETQATSQESKLESLKLEHINLQFALQHSTDQIAQLQSQLKISFRSQTASK